MDVKPVTSISAALDLDVATRLVANEGYDPVLPDRVSGDESVDFERVLPLGGVAGATISFSVAAGSPASQGYMDLSRSYLRMRLPIRQRGDNSTTATDYAGGQALRKGATDYRITGKFPMPGSAETFFAHMIWARVRTLLGGVDMSNDSQNVDFYAQGVYELLTKPRQYFNSRAGTFVAFEETAARGKIPTVAGVTSPINATEAEPYTRQAQIHSEAGWDTGAVIGDSNCGDRSSGAYNPQRVTLWCRLVNGNAEDSPNYIEVGYRPNAGIWNTKYYIPGGISFDLHLDKANDRMPFRSPFFPSNSSVENNRSELYIDWTSSYAQCELMLARRRTTPALLQALAAESLQRSLTIPFIRSRVYTSTFDASNQTIQLSALFQGPRPDVVCCMIVDARALTKSDNGQIGGEQVASWFTSGASIVNRSQGATSAGSPESTAGALATPPHVTTFQVAYGTQRYPQRPFDQPTGADITEAYEAYKQVANIDPALSKYAFQNSLPIYVADLTDSGTGRSSMQGMTSDMSSGIRGSLEVSMTVRPSLINASGELEAQLSYTLVVIGYSTAAVEISQASGTARRLGW